MGLLYIDIFVSELAAAISKARTIYLFSVESKIQCMEQDFQTYETFLKKAFSKMIDHKERVEVTSSSRNPC